MVAQTLPWDCTEHKGKQVQHQTEQSSCCCRVRIWSAEGRWLSLLKRNNVSIDHMTTLIAACCILHNMCEVHKDSFDAQWLDDEVQVSCRLMSSPSSTTPSSTTAINIRNALCDYIDTH